MLEKTLERVPWTARRSNQLILKEINPKYSLEGLMLKLKLQCIGHLMGKANSSENTLMLGKIEATRRRGQQKMRWLDGITDLLDVNLCKLWETARNREAWRAAGMGSQRVRHSLERLNSNHLQIMKVNVYCLNRPVYYILSWQPELFTEGETGSRVSVLFLTTSCESISISKLKV